MKRGKKTKLEIMDGEITALYADPDGNIFDAPSIKPLGRAGDEETPLAPSDLLPLPDGADLMYLPDRQAVGLTADGEILPLTGRPVAAILPPGYTRLFFPAFRRQEKARLLPLYGYTAAALYKGKLCAAAIKTDEADKWNPAHYNTKNLPKLVKQVQKDLPQNRLVTHLAHCALTWHCQTAQNLFFRRWEMGLPVSPVCNAKCLGCISLQPSECCPSPQNRIAFRPSADEIAELAVYHLTTAPDAIASFGQGCEGEPSLAAAEIAAAIKKIRTATDKGQININTNGGFTAGLKKIVDAGLDTMRVSLISAQPTAYSMYYRASYELEAVKNSLRYALEHGIYVSINLLFFPGFSDRQEEVSAWQNFLKEIPVQMVQIRNLNIDPDWFLAAMPPKRSEIIGTRAFLTALKEAQPHLLLGSFSHFIRQETESAKPRI